MNDLTEGLDDESGDDESGDDESGDDESGEDESGAVEDVYGAISRDRRFAGFPAGVKRALAKKAVRAARGGGGGGGGGRRGGSSLKRALRNSQVSVVKPVAKIIRKRMMQMNNQETVAAGASAVITLTAEDDFFPKKVRITGPSLDDFLITDIKVGSESMMNSDDGMVASSLASDDGFLSELFQNAEGKGIKIKAQQRIKFYVTNRGATAAEFAVHIPGMAHVELSAE
jgi:hypothetical protein